MRYHPRDRKHDAQNQYHLDEAKDPRWHFGVSSAIPKTFRYKRMYIMRTLIALVLLLCSQVVLAGPDNNYAWVRDFVSDLAPTSDAFTFGAHRWLASDGEQIVVYAPDQTVRRYDLEGTLQSELTIGSDVDAIDLGPSQELAVVTAETTDNLRVFETDGSLRWAISIDRMDQLDLDLAIAPTGNVFVLSHNEVREYEGLTGSLVRQWGSAGTGNGLPGEIVRGHGIRVSADRVYLQVSGPPDLINYVNAVDAYELDGTFVNRVAVYGFDEVAPAQSLVLNQGALFADNGLWDESFGIYRISALNRNLDLSDWFMEQREMSRLGIIPPSSPENLNGQAVIGDRIFLLDSRAGAVREYRQGSQVIPGVDSPAFPVPYITAQSVRPGETVLDLAYAIDDLDSTQVDVALLARLNGGDQVQDWLRPVEFLEGTASNLGTIDVANTPLPLTWDYGTDLTGLGSDVIDLRLEVVALDDRGLLGVSLVELPAGIPEGTASSLVISTLTFRPDDFLDAYRWLYASGDPAVEQQGNTLVGTSGAPGFEGLVLLDGQTATDDGIDYLLAREGLRRATADEVNRAREAATVGTINRFEPFNALADRPGTVNEYGFETSALESLIHAVPAP